MKRMLTILLTVLMGLFLFACEEEGDEIDLVGIWRVLSESYVETYTYEGETDTDTESYTYDSILEAWLLEVTDTQMKMWENLVCVAGGDVETLGSYTVDGSTITLEDGDGETYTITFTIDGDRLTIEESETYTEEGTTFTEESTTIFERWTGTTPPTEWQNTPDADDYEDDDIENDATALTFPTTGQAHTISSSEDVDWYTFGAAENTTYHIYTTGNLDTKLRLYDSDGYMIDSNDDYYDLNAYIEFECYTTGIYTFIVEPFDTDYDCGSYTINLAQSGPSLTKKTLNWAPRSMSSCSEKEAATK